MCEHVECQHSLGPGSHCTRCDQIARYARDKNESLKANVLELARHHKRTCDGRECTMMLSLLAELLGQAGIYLSSEERREFI